MAGGVLAYVALHRPELISKYKNAQSILGFLLILLGLLLLNKARYFPGWWALFPTLGAFFIISGRGGWLNEKLLANKLLVWIGLISYPLYLWHWPMLSYLRIIDSDVSRFEKIAALALTVVLAWLTYRFVEKPFRLGGNPRSKAAILLAILIIVGAVGVYGAASGGFPARKAAGIDVGSKEYDFASNYRLGKCFLNGTSDDHYADTCHSDSPDKPTVVIWGDSHAAAMYPGLLKQSSLKEFNLTQYTTSGCPPAFDFDQENRKGCKSLNNFVLDKLKTIKPNTIILAAYWLLYDGKHEEGEKPWNYLSEEKISNTISTLKSLGIDNIIVIGQMPTFSQSQTKVGYTSFMPNANNRTYSHYIFESNKSDNRMRKIAGKNNVLFVSPIDTLCNNSGCLISTSLNKFIPLAWDYGHFTTDGSEYFVASALLQGSLKLPGNGRPQR